MLPGKDKIALYQQFIRLEDERSKMGLKGFLDASLDYAEYCIRSDMDKGAKQSIKSKKRKQQLPEQFLIAYCQQSNLQKLDNYIRTVHFIKAVKSDEYQHQRKYGDMVTSEAYTRSFNLKIWKRKTLKIDRTTNHMFCSKDDKVKIYDLNNYLIRESKTKDYYCFVLEAINEKPHLKSRKVHIGFKDIKLYNAWYADAKEGVIECQKTRILKELGIQPYQYLDIANRSILIQSNQKLKNAQIYNDCISNNSILSEKVIEQYQVPKQPLSKVPSDKPSINKKDSIDSVEEIKEVQKPIIVQTLTKQLCDSDGEQQLIQQLQQIEQKQNLQDSRKKCLNLFHQIMPEFQLDSLNDQNGYQLIETEGQMRLFRSSEFPQKYKFFMTIHDADQEKVFDPIAHIDTYTKWNTSIEEVSIKNLIQSENTAIIYQKHKAYSKIYRARDFIFLRHVFKKDNNLYMVDKSIDNANYPPFMTIVRGQINAVWGIMPAKPNVLVSADIQIKNQGYINQAQDHNLSMVYLKCLFQIPGYLIQKGFKKDESVHRMFDLEWDLSKNQNNIVVEQNRQRRISQMHQKIKQAELPKPIPFKQGPDMTGVKFTKKNTAAEGVVRQQKNTEQTAKQSNSGKKSQAKPEKTQSTKESKSSEKTQKKGRVATQPATQPDDLGEYEQCNMAKGLSTNLAIDYVFDGEGRVVIPQDYLNHHYLLEPQPPCPLVLQQAINGHPIWKGQWIFDKAGGIIFVNQKKIDQQKGVLKFILTKIGKNLLSGKSILNISLPVDIFAGESNLQRLAFSMSYGPLFLEKAAKEKDPIQKMKYCVAYGITNSVLYLNMEKPFNPILGQTFQGWINGCPIYMQQVSHHPPIASYLFLGRGYKVTGSVQSKVELHMNSGCGITDGANKIQFADGSDIAFLLPGGQLSGLTYGDRKFNLSGKSYYWSIKHNLFLEITFDPNKKGFFSMSKKQTPSDYLQGNIVQVTPQFLQQFIKQKKKKQGPQPKDILAQKSKVTGVWCKEILVEGEKVLDLDKDFGCKLQFDKYLLASDGNWREDIAYRRKLNISRAQNEKQRLEVLQRKDRKLREAVHGKSH